MAELRLAVRELAEFCHRSGDIDYRFTPSPSAEQGIAGHQLLQSRRDYEAEYKLEDLIPLEGFDLRLGGRADGYDPTQPLLEEIKTCRVKRDAIPPAVEALHWAQLMLYGGLLCRAEPFEEVSLLLTYYNVDSGDEWPRLETVSREELLTFLDGSLKRMGDWLRAQHAWREKRDASLEAMPFPYGDFRGGQRDMAETVYKCIVQEGQALLEAPTGTGKTAAVLFPALKAMATGQHERIAFATARTVGRRAAEDCLRDMQGAGMQLRRLSLTAKDAICFSPGKACHADDCAYAAGYYDRLPAAMDQAMEQPDLDRGNIEIIAREHEVCPYQLGMDLLPWVDLSISDIHYLYSFNATVAGQFAEQGLRWSLLLDEAHNLPERARDMYSAGLSKAALMAARHDSAGAVKKALDRCNRIFLALDKEDWLEEQFDSRLDAPDALDGALSGFVGAVGEQLAASPTYLQARPALLDFYFDCLQFQRVLDAYGDDYRFEMHRDGRPQGLKLSLRCLDASRLLSERQNWPLAVTAFSATVSPPMWMLKEMGFGEDAVFQSLPSPFHPEQLSVAINSRLDTRYRSRQQSLPGVVDAVADWLEQHTGNCIVYFSAYAYMQDVLDQLTPRLADRHLCVQSRHWREAERTEMLDTLEARRDVAAFCILGGVFGEGIDLPGDALSSVVVVGVGLPQFNREREVLRDYYQSGLGQGFEYAYLYPGMQRVSQAIGRVIRRESDTGSALLIDPRYAQPDYRALLPPWWDYGDSSPSM